MATKNTLSLTFDWIEMVANDNPAEEVLAIIKDRMYRKLGAINSSLNFPEVYTTLIRNIANSIATFFVDSYNYGELPCISCSEPHLQKVYIVFNRDMLRNWNGYIPTICDECLRYYTRRCPGDCGTRVFRSSTANVSTFLTRLNRNTTCMNQFCDTCDPSKEEQKTCQDCGSYYEYPNDIDDRESSGICYNCVKRSRIMEYNYRPHDWEPRYARNESGRVIMFGIENEASLREMPAAFLTRASNRRSFVKRDGSVTPEGIEVVWQPMTLKYARAKYDSLFTPLYKKEVTLGRVRADRLASCGLHIHMSMNSFNGPEHIAAYTNFMNTELARYMSRRRSKYWMPSARSRDFCKEEFYSVDEVMDKWVGNQHHRRDKRYSHVNLCNKDTVETRIFQGTTNPRRIMAAMEFCKLGFDVTQSSNWTYRPNIDYTLVFAEKYASDYPVIQSMLGRFKNA